VKTAFVINGYFSSKSDPIWLGGKPGSTGRLSYEYLKKELFEKAENDVDVFIHSWDIQNKQKVLDLYGDNVKDYKFEEQIDFSNIVDQKTVDWFDEGFNRRGSGYESCTFETIFSYLYGRKEAIDIKSNYEKKNNFTYDCVLIGRFDLGLRGKEHRQIYYPTNIYYNENLDMNYVYTPYWNQFNVGYADHWWLSNSKNADIIGKWFEKSKEYFSINSDYVKAATTGWFDSNGFDLFSNEVLKKKEHRSKYLMKCSKWYCVNTHLCSKWFMNDIGLYKKTRSVII
jgi:hypothetical protein